MSNFSAGAWKEPYAAALRESDPEKVHAAVLAAEDALFQRGQEINGSAEHHAVPQRYNRTGRFFSRRAEYCRPVFFPRLWYSSSVGT